jgi:hypothetical protein
MMIKTMVIAAMLLGATASGVFAQGAAQPAAGGMAVGGGMAACREDVQKFCADKTGPDRRACMETNKDKLSDACKTARAARAGGQ